MLRRVGAVAVVGILSVIGCNADLAGGNPCYAVILADCGWADKCHKLPSGKSASDCRDDSKTFIENCTVSIADARSCSSDIDSESCTDPLPASCYPVYGAPPPGSSGSDTGSSGSDLGSSGFPAGSGSGLPGSGSSGSGFSGSSGDSG